MARHSSWYCELLSDRPQASSQVTAGHAAMPGTSLVGVVPFSFWKTDKLPMFFAFFRREIWDLLGRCLEQEISQMVIEHGRIRKQPTWNKHNNPGFASLPSYSFCWWMFKSNSSISSPTLPFQVQLFHFKDGNKIGPIWQYPMIFQHLSISNS